MSDSLDVEELDEIWEREKESEDGGAKREKKRKE